MTPGLEGIAVVLTATIDPGGTPWVERRDPVLRRRDYETNLRRWLREPDVAEIIFCENSGADLSGFAEIAKADRVPLTLLGYRAVESDAVRGKGYGELGILDAVVQHCLANRAGLNGRASSHLLKVTGRYWLENLAEVVAEIRLRRDADVLAVPTGKHEIVGSECFYASIEFLRDFLLPQRPQVSDAGGYSIEHALARAAMEAARAGRTYCNLNSQPRIVGVSGTTNLPRVVQKGPSWIELSVSPDYIAACRRVVQAAGVDAMAGLQERLEQESAVTVHKIRFDAQEIAGLKSCVVYSLETFGEARFYSETGLAYRSAQALIEAIDRILVGFKSERPLMPGAPGT